MAEGSTGLSLRAQELATRMLDTVNSAQYTEYFEADPSLEGTVGALVLHNAQGGRELSPTALDYAIENFGRHGISQEELFALVGDLSVRTEEEAEARLRAVHVALEVSLVEGFPQGVGPETSATAQTRIEAIRTTMDTLAVVETLTGEQFDSEGLLDLAEQYRGHLIEAGKAVTAESAMDNLIRLSHAGAVDLGRFLANRYSSELPEQEEYDYPAPPPDHEIDEQA